MLIMRTADLSKKSWTVSPDETETMRPSGPPQSALREGFEDPEQLGRYRRIELGVGARFGFPVGTPPLKMGPVPEAIVL